MGWWFEAWTLPHEATYQRKIAYLPVVGGYIEDSEDRTRALGAITIPAAFPRLSEVIHIDDDDHANDVGSLIIAFHSEHLGADNRPAPVLAFYADRVSDEVKSVPTSTVEITGNVIYSCFNHVTTFPWDYPVSPYVEGDWVWGGDDELGNGGFEDPSFSNEVQRISLNGADGGTFTLANPLNLAEVTGALAWNVSTEDMRTAIIVAWNGILDVSISGSGQNTDSWSLEFTDPGGVLFPALIVVNAASLTNVGPEGVYVNREPGGQPVESGWTKNNQIEANRELGTYTVWEPATDRVRTGSYSFKINCTQFGGIQKRMRVIAGHRYNAGAWLQPDLASKQFRLIIRGTVNEDFNLIANSPWSGVSATYPMDVWSEVPTGEFVPHVSDIIWRFAYVGTGSSGDWWVDDAWLRPGAAATTVGDILLQLWRDASLDHVGAGRGVAGVLAWLVPTFSETLDSNGVAWDGDRSMFVSVNDKLGEVIEQLIGKWGYRMDIWYDNTTAEWKWDMFNPGGMGTDNTGTHDNAILLGKNGFESGPLVKRAPSHTAFLAEGDGQYISLNNDAALEGPWGRREGGDLFSFVGRPEDLTDVSAEQQRLAIEGMIGASIKLAATSTVIPLVHIKPGDKIPIHLGDKHPWRTRHVQACRIDFGEYGRVASMSVTLGSDVFGSLGFAGLAEGVRRLLTKLKREKKDLGGGLFDGGGGTIPWLVAASDSPEVWKAIAAYVCTGIDDNVTISSAYTALTAGGGVVEPAVYLAPGNYAFRSTTGTPSLTWGGHLIGLGGAYIYQDNTGVTNPGPLIELTYGSRLENISIDATDCSAVSIINGDITVTGCIIYSLTTGYAITVDTGNAGQCVIQGNFIYAGSDGGMYLYGNRYIVTDNVVLAAGAQVGIFIFDSENSVVANNIVEGAVIGVQAGTTAVGISTDEMVVSGNLLEFCGTAVLVTDAERITVSGNHASYPETDGIVIRDSDRCKVSDNHMSQPGSATTDDGIRLEGDSNGNVVTDNMVFPTAPATLTFRYGINVADATCDNNVVADNFLGDASAYGTGSWNNVGTGTITSRDANGQFTW